MHYQSKSGRRLANAIQRPVNVGLFVVATAILGLGVWAAVTPLASAAIASGKVSPAGSKRVVQHLEGGIVRSLSVKEGDVVEQGAMLAVLEPAQARAQFNAQRRKLIRLQVTRDRLAAEALGEERFEISVAPLPDGIDGSFADYVATERQTFTINQELRASERTAYEKQIGQVRSEITSLNAQFKGAERQRALLLEELEAKRSLLQQGLVRKPEVLALEGRLVEFDAGRDAITATIARAEQKIGEIEVAQLSSQTEFKRKVADALAGVNAEIVQVEEALAASDDILARTQIRSPISGKVLEVAVKTIGGVVRPGEAMFTIVPIEEDLIIDARLEQTDIDNVRVGMDALVQVNVFSARSTRPLRGKLSHVGADVVRDEQTGAFYFPIKVTVEPSEDEKVAEIEKRLAPGMPADVFILTGSKTVARYFMEPITASFHRAFRED